MTAKDVLLRLSPSAVFRILGADEVEAVIDGEQYILPMSHYRVALEFSSARTLGDVRAVLAQESRVDDFAALVDRLTTQGILSHDSVDDSNAPLQTILNARTFHDTALLPRIGREVEQGRAVVIADALEPDLASRVHAALEGCTRWKPYEGQVPFFHFRHHNLYGWSALPAEVRECARVLGG